MSNDNQENLFGEEINDNQKNLFGDEFDDMQAWKEHWQDMPEFATGNSPPFQSIIVHFVNEKDRNDFAEILNQKITYKTKSLWYPEQVKGKFKNYNYVDENSLERTLDNLWD